MLRDRLVCGVNNEAIQRKLLAERDLTYERALAIAQGSEEADKNLRETRNEDCEQEPVRKQSYWPLGNMLKPRTTSATVAVVATISRQTVNSEHLSKLSKERTYREGLSE